MLTVICRVLGARRGLHPHKGVSQEMMRPMTCPVRRDLSSSTIRPCRKRRGWGGLRGASRTTRTTLMRRYGTSRMCACCVCLRLGDNPGERIEAVDQARSGGFPPTNHQGFISLQFAGASNSGIAIKGIGIGNMHRKV